MSESDDADNDDDGRDLTSLDLRDFWWVLAMTTSG